MQGEATDAAHRRREVASRLNERRAEIEQTALTRVHSLAPESVNLDPEYVDGLRSSVLTAVAYGLLSIERADDDPPAVPPALMTQARLAARSAVPIVTVLRRYFAGFTLISDCVFDEAERIGVSASALRLLTRQQSLVFDRLIGTIARAYADEEEKVRLDGLARTVAERLRRLLDGELVDMDQFDYSFAGCHVGIVGVGDRVADFARELSRRLDSRLLIARPQEEMVWGWMGHRDQISTQELELAVNCSDPGENPVALGEPCFGLTGWRLTHRQAKAGFPIARRRREPVRYGEISLLATLLQDELLAASLQEMYLKPFEEDRDGGRTARQTLRAYFAAGRNVSSAGAALGVSRRTVANRLQSIEEKLPRPLASVIAELEAALMLDELIEPQS